MNAHVAACGRLNMDLELRTAGKAWLTARLAVTMPQPYGAGEDADPPTSWLSIPAFDQVAETLVCHVRGECLSVAGRVEMLPYVARDGERRQGQSCIADRVIGPRAPRPRGGGKSKAGNSGAAVQSAATPDPTNAPCDDPIGF